MDDPQIIEMHQQWNGADYALYDHFNKTFHKAMEDGGQDFQDEVALYKIYNTKVADYCAKVVAQMTGHPQRIYDLHKNMKPLRLPPSKWSEAVDIDPVWCAATQIDIMPFYNILRIKQFPQICKYIEQFSDTRPHMFRLDDKRHKINMVRNYCVDNVQKTMIPLAVLATPGIYTWY